MNYLQKPNTNNVKFIKSYDIATCLRTAKGLITKFKKVFKID